MARNPAKSPVVTHRVAKSPVVTHKEAKSPVEIVKTVLAETGFSNYREIKECQLFASLSFQKILLN